MNINLYAWCNSLAFMIRKIEAIFNGETDYDYEIKDIEFNYIPNKAQI